MIGVQNIFTAALLTAVATAAALTDANDVFRATITMSGNTPVVSWTPVLPAAEAAKRTYTVFGRQSLLAGDWTAVSSGQEANYNFFKVRVEMK